MLASASGPKIAAATPGLSATRRSVICYSSREKAMPVTTCCSTISSGIVEGRSHIDFDLVDHRDLDGPHLQDLGAERGHFQHFLEGHLVEAARLGNDARIGGVDAVDVGVDVAAVGVQRGRQRHGGGVGAAAPERRDAAGLGVNALEARDDRHLALREAVDDALALDAGDAGRAMRLVGEQRDLPALPRPGLDPHVLEHDGEQAGGDKFARGDDRVIFGGVIERRGFLAPGHQFVGLAGHGGNHDRDFVPGLDLAFDMARDVADAVHIGDAGAAEFHDKA